MGKPKPEMPKQPEPSKIEGGKAAPPDRLKDVETEHAASREKIADIAALQREAERKLDAGNNTQNLLDEYYKDGGLRKVENALNRHEIEWRPGDSVFLSGKWISVEQKNGKKSFSLLGSGKKSYEHLFRFLQEETALLPEKKEDREKFAQTPKQEKKNPLLGLQQEFQKFLQAVISREYVKSGPEKLADFLNRATREISSQMANLNSFSDASDFTTKMRQALYRPFSANLSPTPSEGEFFQQLFDQGFKSKLVELYEKVDQKNESSGTGMFDMFAQQMGYKDTGDMLSKIFEGLFEFLGPALNQLGISQKSIGEDIEKRKTAARKTDHLKGKNPEYDASRLDPKEQFSPDEHIQFVSKMFGLGADFHTNYRNESGMMDFYLDLQTMGMAETKCEMMKSDQFQKNLQVGDVLFTTLVDTKNLHSRLGSLATVSSVEGGKILVNYLPPSVEAGNPVSPKNTDLETFLSDCKAGLYGSIRPKVKAPVA